MAAAGVVQGQGGDVQAPAHQGGPLVQGLEQRLPRVDPDQQVNVGRLDLPGNDLHHLVADVAGAAGPLMRGSQYGLRRTCDGRHAERGGQAD